MCEQRFQSNVKIISFSYIYAKFIKNYVFKLLTKICKIFFEKKRKKMQNTLGVSINKSVKESLSKWDQLTPLSDLQIKSILSLSQLNQFQINENESINQTVESSLPASHADQSPQRNVLHKVLKALILKYSTIL